jgi:hypothetical protein
VRVDRSVVKRLDRISLKQAQNLIVGKGAVTRKVHMRDSLSSALIGKPLRRNTNEGGGLFDGVFELSRSPIHVDFLHIEHGRTT